METTPQKRTGYEVFCNNLYSNTIQEERQRILKFFGIKRNIIGHLNVQDDTKFIDILEQRKIISTANVDQLLECLNMLGLEKLTEITIGYKSAIATEPSTTTFVEEDDEDLKTCKCANQEDQERLLCLDCSEYICFDCFISHHDHEVVSQQDMDGVIRNYQRLVQKELSEVQKMAESCKEDVNIERSNSIVEEIKKEVSTFSNSIRTAMTTQLKSGIEEHEKVKSAHHEALTKAKKDFGRLSIMSSNVSKHVKQNHDSPSLIYLQKLNNLKGEISQGIEKAKSVGETVESVVQYCPASLSARVATIVIGPIIGVVRVNKRQVIIVTDQRLKDPPSIHLSCVSCDSNGDNHWSHVIDYLTILGPVEKLPTISMCNSLQTKPPKRYMLIGCGSKIVRIEIQEPRDFCYYDSLTVEEVKGLPQGSDIMCMNIIPSHTWPASVLIVDSASGSITRFDGELVKQKTLSLHEKAYLAAGVYENARYIYAYSNGTEVKVIDGDSPTNVIRVIYTPPGPHAFYPADMFHDCAAFSVLWKSKHGLAQRNKIIKVVVYSSYGELKRICHEQKEGRSEGIGISYVRNAGLLCLTNGKMELYDTLVKGHDKISLLQPFMGLFE